MEPASDLKSHYQPTPSNRESALSGTNALNGTGISCLDFEGPIEALFLCEDATGSPTAQNHACKLQESDTVGGTYTDCINQRTANLTADNQAKIVTAHRTKEFVRGVITSAFTGGSSPGNVGHSVILGRKKDTSST